MEVSFETVAASGQGYENKTRHYALEWRAADSALWQIVPGYADIVGAGQSVTYAVPATGDAALYRARVWLTE